MVSSQRGELVRRPAPPRPCRPEQHHLVADLDPGDVGDVHHAQVHAHAPHDGRPPPADQHLAPGWRATRVAVGVAHRKGGDAGRPRRGPGAPVRDGRPRRHRLQMHHRRLPAEHRLERPGRAQPGRGRPDRRAPVLDGRGSALRPSRASGSASSAAAFDRWRQRGSKPAARTCPSAVRKRVQLLTGDARHRPGRRWRSASRAPRAPPAGRPGRALEQRRARSAGSTPSRPMPVSTLRCARGPSFPGPGPRRRARSRCSGSEDHRDHPVLEQRSQPPS